MSSPIKIKIMTAPSTMRLSAQKHVNNTFNNYSHLVHEDISLELIEHFSYSEAALLGYDLAIKQDGQSVGSLTIIISDGFTNNAYEGSAGITLDNSYLNKGIPFKAFKAVIPVFEHHGQDRILITFDKDKRSIKEVCLQLGAEYLDTIEDADGSVKERYVVTLK